ncbi:MAG: ABC transporter ATP-binding protein [Clostridiales bacterium]|nr:ABC transporter ATP-binding protein [Clostridiales bacterium]
MIEVKNIKKSYGKKQVLKDITFSASKGECIAIAGLNGCGKSTLLSILSGTLKSDGGEFFVNGVNIMKAPAKRKGLIGYVPQENPLIAELSVRDNLKLWYCDSRLDMDDELENGVLHMLGIHEFADMPVNKLSGGMKKRVSIGCAVSYDPPVLILDEPSAALDLACKENIAEYLQAHKSREGIILITTHDEAELRICNRLLVMKNGELKEEDVSLKGRELLSKL